MKSSSIRVKQSLRGFSGIFKPVAVAAFAIAISLSPLMADGVKIEFLPPPMQGNISLGIYDTAGKLVRVLHSEADTSEFTVALNGLVTQWDGLDNKGEACAPGKYHARGFMVGDTEIEGLDYLGNDWVNSDDAPHISRISAIGTAMDGKLFLKAVMPVANGEVADPKAALSTFIVKIDDGDAELAAASADEVFPEATAKIQDGQVFQRPDAKSADWTAIKLSGLTSPSDAAPGRDGSVWVLDGGDIKQFSAAGVLKRTVPAPASEPTPVKISASPLVDALFVLAQNDSSQSFEELSWVPEAGSEDAPPTANAPRVVFKKVIQFSDRLEEIAPKLKFSNDKPFVAAPTFSLTLMPNPLIRDARGTADVKITVDGSGSFLSTVDGLPLYHVSENPNLRWAAIGREPESKAITIFQSDGAVIEGFKAEHVANMMSFDAGDVELTTTAVVPGKQDGEEPAAPPSADAPH